MSQNMSNTGGKGKPDPEPIEWDGLQTTWPTPGYPGVYIKDPATMGLKNKQRTAGYLGLADPKAYMALFDEENLGLISKSGTKQRQITTSALTTLIRQTGSRT